MTEFFTRMKQRKLVQWAIAYGAFAFALIQVIDVVASKFDWPAQLERSIILALAVGFVVALVVAWYHGEQGRQRVSGPELLLLALVLAIGGGAVWFFGRGAAQPIAESTSASSAAKAPGASSVAAAVIPAQPIPAKSVAVLAFSDLSPNHDQGYFSDGMSDEIRNALAQINDLKVAGRDSSSYFKGKDESLRGIGKTLGVANVLEGSVRKQGGEVRITAELIRVSDDTQLWSHAYDGNLSDVFKLQEDIARRVTDQLKVVLDASQQTQLVNVGTTNTAAYTLYLKATDVLDRRDYDHVDEAVGWLQQAIKLDPDFARAHSRLALILALEAESETAAARKSESEVLSQAHAALALDPTDAEAQAALGMLADNQRRFLDARLAMERAFALAPNDASINFYLAETLLETGYTRQGTAHLDRALAIDPLLPDAQFWKGMEYVYAGDFDAAQRTFQRASHLGLTFIDAGFVWLAEARGDHAEARALSLSFGKGPFDSCLRQPAEGRTILANGMFGGDAPARAKALAVIDECLAAKPTVIPVLIPLGLMYLDQPQRVLEIIERVTDNDSAVFDFLWGPEGQSARRLPTFAAFARKIGFAALWDKYGPPDLCKKNAAGDYVCTK